MVLVGNKTDLKNDRVITKKQGEELAAQLKVCNRVNIYKK